MIPFGIKLPSLSKYVGKTDPTVFFQIYTMAMTPLYLREPIVLHLFLQYLDSVALHWYHQKNIVYHQTIDELASAFIEHFNIHLNLEWLEKKLKNVKQGENEKFTVFIERWKAVSEEIDSLPSEQRQIDMILEKVNDQYSIGFAIKTFQDKKKLLKIGNNLDEAFDKERKEGKTVKEYVAPPRP
ncbi:uncharacterized protein LOC124932865 [Impatiens glandulifera]|uniref:uncharacterized protein LOC124932865 n=1 Tax=Impatiens glandulifera TaxID=253017 RepID=UPI001FB10198|nr:uncharacterized protein LOC124932865 [Impatiens glandulifera]